MAVMMKVIEFYSNETVGMGGGYSVTSMSTYGTNLKETLGEFSGNENSSHNRKCFCIHYERTIKFPMPLQKMFLQCFVCSTLPSYANAMDDSSTYDILDFIICLIALHWLQILDGLGGN